MKHQTEALVERVLSMHFRVQDTFLLLTEVEVDVGDVDENGFLKMPGDEGSGLEGENENESSGGGGSSKMDYQT